MPDGATLDALVASLRKHGFVPRSPDCWEFETELETHRYLTFRIHEAPETTYVLDAQEWRGGEGYEDEVLRTSSIAEATAALDEWGPWASEVFVMTRWRRFLNRIGLHYLY